MANIDDQKSTAVRMMGGVSNIQFNDCDIRADGEAVRMEQVDGAAPKNIKFTKTKILSSTKPSFIRLYGVKLAVAATIGLVGALYSIYKPEILGALKDFLSRLAG